MTRSPHGLERRSLNMFLVVAAELNLHRAAERLGVSQPAVTSLLSRMEDRLGFDLFVREKKRLVSLTAAGDAYHVSAGRILTELDNASHRARAVSRGKAGVLRIGLCEEVTTARVLELISTLRAQMPDIVYELVELRMTALAGAVHRADVDVCVIPLPCADPDLRIVPLWQENLVVVMPPDCTMATCETVRCVDLAGVPLILGREEAYGGASALIRHAFDRAGIAPRIVVTAQRRSTMLAMVHAGLGVSFVPAYLRGLGLRDLVMAPFEDASVNVALACARDGISAAASTFVAFVTDFNPALDRVAP